MPPQIQEVEKGFADYCLKESAIIAKDASFLPFFKTEKGIQGKIREAFEQI